MAGKKKEKMSWVINPLKERPVNGAVGIVLSVACTAAAVLYVKNLLISLPLSFIFVWSLSPLFLTYSYELTSKHVSYQTFCFHSESGWANFGGAFHSKNSVLLTRYSQPSWIDRWQGLVLFVKDEEQAQKAASMAKRMIDRCHKRNKAKETIQNPNGTQ